MPRVAKPRQTMTGQPAQPIAPVAGQEYGLGQAQMDMQRQLPAPNVQAPQASPPALQAATPPSGGGSAPGQPVEPPAPPDVMAIAKAMPGGPGLFASPGSGQITRGLPSGPGPGPEVLNMPSPSPIADALRELSKATGDSYFADLARKNGM